VRAGVIVRAQRAVAVIGRPLKLVVRQHRHSIRMSIPDVLFWTFGIFLLAHIGSCAVLCRALSTRPELEGELFATPNRPLGTPPAFRLLRARYYLTWQATPSGVRSLEPWVRSTLTLARITGALFLIGGIGFPFAAFVTATS
jgi:hypothetical protein